MDSRVKLLLSVATFSLLVTGAGFWYFERGANPEIDSAFDVVWWWVVTSATVGYGDIVPVTTPGRAVSIVAIVTGFFVYANSIAIIAETIHEFMERRQRGTAKLGLKHHVVLCEYTAIADELIQSLPSCRGFEDREIVVVSDLISMNPYPEHHFVRGVPINPASLRKANVQEADYVFVFANMRFADPDVKTIHTVSRIVDLNPQAKIFMELVDPENDLVRYAPGDLTIMDSRRLLISVLRDKQLDPNQLEVRRISHSPATGPSSGSGG